MTRRERLLLGVLAALAFVLRVATFFRYRFDSDEQQHLHVVWGWTAGLVQYRDLFDNHAPLFHMVMAPLLAVLGERSDILLWMRVPMLVLFAIVVWATYAIARRLYDERIAAFAAMLLVLFPPYFLKSLEFRNDNLWTALWMLVLLALLRRRMFVAGVLLGAAFAVSLKTAVLVVALVVGGGSVGVLGGRGVAARDAATSAGAGRRRSIAQALGGFVLVPLAVVVFFVLVGGWDALVFCNFTFNRNFAATRTHLWVGRATFPLMFGAVLWLAWHFRANADRWRYYLAVVAGVFTVTLAGFWPVISPRDFLPMMPIAAIFAAAALMSSSQPVRAFAIAAAVCLVSLFHYADRFADRTAWHITMMDQALRLSHPGEPLIDHKGETIYRRRPFYFALEIATRTLISRGVVRDTIAEDVVRTRTHVAQADGAMWPPRGRAFLSENFVNLGRLRASGQEIREDGTFTIAVPGEYVIVSERGEVRGGLLDGSAYGGARELGAGAHRFVGEKKVTVLWAPAFRRGHSPYHLRDTEF
ncbi:MAG: ArnT family glycosyltransferase [Thermoanaerobaculia bacterium]